MARWEGAVHSYLRQEAAAAERLAARARIGLVAALTPPALVAAALADRGFTVASYLAMGLVYGLAFAALLRSAPYRPAISYAAVTADIAYAAAAIASFVATGRPEDVVSSYLVAFVLALLVSAAALRRSVELVQYATVLALVSFVALHGAGYARPPGTAIAVTAGHFVAATTLLAGSGGLAVVLVSRTQGLLARALDTLTFMFADLRGFTRYAEEHGDARATALIAEYRRIVRAELSRAGGTEQKTEGDGFFAVFPSARQAVACAIGILRTSATRAAGLPDLPLAIGIGLHSGEPTVHEGDYVGSAVNLAARLAQRAGPGELLVSEVVRGLLHPAEAPPMREVRDLQLKGIAAPPRVYAVEWSTEGPGVASPTTRGPARRPERAS